MTTLDRLMDAAGLPALQDAIRHLHGVEARLVESVPVVETWKGETLWRGEVQVFDLIGHPTATRAYAWSYLVDDVSERRKFIAILHAEPVTSPLAAVQASLLAERRARQN